MKIKDNIVLITGGASGIGKIFRGIPFAFHFIRTLQGLLPIKGIDLIFGDFCGIYSVMDHYTGRK
ncbi:MAG: hypothetical protein MJY86_03430 [Bacteroidales bacterium]|nr:hypothetical protein [Bacteroidales bacterium]